MINAMPILINSLFPFMTKSVHNDAKHLIETGREVFAAAETETNFGDLANGMIKSGKGTGNLVEIAAWHYERGIKKYREAMRKFEKAGKYDLPNKYAKYIESKKNECVKRANAAFSKKSEAETLMGK